MGRKVGVGGWVAFGVADAGRRVSLGESAWVNVIDGAIAVDVGLGIDVTGPQAAMSRIMKRENCLFMVPPDGISMING